MRTYGQYCPMARASELLAERWTLIIVRNLLAGCTTYGELLDGAPGISRALLTQRLALLEEQDVITKDVVTGRTRCQYTLTERGRELRAVVQAMGEWGARWLELEPHHDDQSAGRRHPGARERADRAVRAHRPTARALLAARSAAAG